jgi:GNAT superfamily N-acetyltransferase
MSDTAAETGQAQDATAYDAAYTVTWRQPEEGSTKTKVILNFDGDFVARADLSDYDACVWLHWIEVQPNREGTGYGGYLLDAIAKAFPGRLIALYPWPGTDTWFKRRGFTEGTVDGLDPHTIEGLDPFLLEGLTGDLECLTFQAPGSAA